MSRRSGRMATSGGGGHPSITDDGSGNVVIAAGKFVGQPTYHHRYAAAGVYTVTNSADAISAEATVTDMAAARPLRMFGDVTYQTGTTMVVPNGWAIDAPNCGIDFESGRLDVTINGGVRQRIVNATMSFVNGLSAVFSPSADQSITGTGITILANAGHIKITSDGVYSLSNAIAAGSDGQRLTIENISANTVTLQEGHACAQSVPIVLVYSTDAAIWLLET